MSEEIVSGSQTETTPQLPEEKPDVASTFAAFGLTPPSEGETVKQASEASENGAETVKEDAPAIEQQTEAERKVFQKVKHNKEEREVFEDEVPELLQKGLALDKERERRSEYERELDEAATLLGFKDRNDYLANKERIRQEREQKQMTAFDELKQQMIQEYEEAGYDPEKLQTWLDSHPVLKQAQEVLQRENESRQAQQRAQQFDALYTAFPELRSEIDSETGQAPWYTAEMHSLVEAGTPPLIAYKALNAERIAERKAKTAEQRAIKDVQLGKRSHVETSGGTNEPIVPAHVAAAFSAFGLEPNAAKKYIKK